MVFCSAAISMTLCEIATAKHYSLPLECHPFSPEGKDPRDPRTRSECVDALSRSAQFWSSYSGYLREIPQLCFAFRRWNDIDLARDIYKNATIENINFLRSLVNREKSEEVLMQKKQVQLTVCWSFLRTCLLLFYGRRSSSDYYSNYKQRQKVTTLFLTA